MAKKKSTAIARPTYYAQPIRTPAPIVRVSVPGLSKKKPTARRRKGGGGGGGGSLGAEVMGAALTAGAIGLAEKSGLMDKLPAIPVIGRKGTLAVAAYFWARNGGGKIARDVAICAAVLSLYEYAKDGTISGADYT